MVQATMPEYEKQDLGCNAGKHFFYLKDAQLDRCLFEVKTYAIGYEHINNNKTTPYFLHDMVQLYIRICRCLNWLHGTQGATPTRSDGYRVRQDVRLPLVISQARGDVRHTTPHFLARPHRMVARRGCDPKDAKEPHRLWNGVPPRRVPQAARSLLKYNTTRFLVLYPRATRARHTEVR